MKKIYFLLAAAAMGIAAAAFPANAEATKFKLCTGNIQLNYFKAGHMVKAKFPGRRGRRDQGLAGQPGQGHQR